MSEETAPEVAVPERTPNKIEKAVAKVLNFFNENKAKFETKRQASKYLMGFGKVWKEEHNIPLESSKKGGLDIPPTPKSPKKKVRKTGKK